MATNSEMVSEFRGIVDRVIEYKASRVGSQRYGMRQHVEVEDLVYASVSPGHIRTRVIGAGREHRWAIVTRYPIARHGLGSVAVVSVAGNDDRLLRNVAVSMPFGGQASIEKPLTDQGDIEAALDWARSPDQFAENIALLAALDPAEDLALQERYAEREASLVTLQSYTEASRVARAWAAAHARDVWLG